MAVHPVEERFGVAAAEQVLHGVASWSSAPERGDSSVLQGLDGAAALAEHLGDLLDGEVTDDCAA